jgi:SAC3/GANP family
MPQNGSQWGAAHSGFTPQQVGYPNIQHGVAYSQQQSMVYSSQQIHQQQQVTNTNLVLMYTQYYHQWMAVHTERSKDSTMESEAAWAKYHADLSTRAAHYFHANPTIHTPPTDFVLPPAPPAPISATVNIHVPSPPNHNGVGSNNVAFPNQYQQPINPFRAQAWQQPVQQSTPSQPANLTHPIQPANGGTLATSTVGGGEAANDKMKRFVDRCLLRYNNTPENKVSIMKQIELLIATEIRNGTLQTVDWDTKPLVEMPQQLEVSQQIPFASNADRLVGTGKQKEHQPPHNSQDNYYGPSIVDLKPTGTNVVSGSFTTNNAMSGKRQKVNYKSFDRRNSSVSSANDNYYGPTITNTLQSNDDYNDSEDFISIPSYNKSIVNKKKKSSVIETGFTQSDAVLSNRANRFAGKGGVVGTSSSMPLAKQSSGEWDRYMGKTTIGGTNKKLDEIDYERMTIRGTCQILEKEYLRLTAPPRAELVRPLPILRQHLQNLKSDPVMKSRDYLWYCSQLKAIRQDCTVQRIQNEFSVDVYETHAKIALEEDDLNEYNQCQTQLKELYLLLSGAKVDEATREDALRNRNEFVAYRLIYYVVLAVESHKYEGGSSDIFKIMISLTHQQRNNSIIKHALAVREACCSSILDYHAFFRLRNESSTTGASHMVYLLDRIVPRMRYEALLRICKGYRPTLVPVAFILKEIGFGGDVESGQTWLRSCGCVLSGDNLLLITKDTVVHESVEAEAT